MLKEVKMKQKHCGVCGKKIGLWSSQYLLKDGIICNNCATKTQLLKKSSQAEMDDYFQSHTIAEINNLLNISNQSSNNENQKISDSSIQNSFFDIFHVRELKEEIVNLKTENANLKKETELKLSVQQMKPVELDALIEKKNSELNELDKTIKTKQNKEKQLTTTINSLYTKVDELNNQIVDLSEEINYESYGLYKPRYEFSNSSTYKGKLTEVRFNQKTMIRNEIAAEIFEPMTMNGSLAKGKSMQKKNIKQLLRSFNGECEAAINKVTKSNIETIEKRINTSFAQLNKLNEPNGIRLTTDYLDSKLDEAHIGLEYALKKEEEKEQLREQREREREEKKLQREIASERAKYEKDEAHFTQAKDRIADKLSATTDTSEMLALKHQLQELQDKLNNIRERKEKLQDRAANPTAGYVYIISNIGSFGKDVYKIGVTRRLDPMDRINELGNASVPFKFDVNALVFSEDAFSLESSLHTYFKEYRVNRVNKRKEYFKVPMNKIKEVLAKHKELTFDFNEYPDAYEYRDTLYIEEHEKEKTATSSVM